MTESSPSDVDQLIAALSSQDAVDRQKARQALTGVGSPAVSSLLTALSNDTQHVRWEAAKTLQAIADPAAAGGLVNALGDDDSDVRWVAAEALIALKQDAVKPVLLGLIGSQDSAGLYKSVHHVLHDLSNDGALAPVLKPVMEALEQNEPEVAAPVAARQALDQIG